MAIEDKHTARLLDEVESKLKDRFTHYLVLAMDGDLIYNCYDSKIVARGMAEYIIDEIRNEQKEEIG